MNKLEEPTLKIPLAPSYNERGIAGFTTTVTNAIDQRKINVFFELIENTITGKRTLYLTKRPGFYWANQINSSVGSVYLITKEPNGADSGSPWVFSIAAGAVKASRTADTNTIFTDGAATWYPSYVDTTIISGVVQVVLQCRKNNTGAQRVFYASAIGAWSEISDGDFTGLSHKGKMEHIDGWALILASDNYIYGSDLNSISSWAPTNRIAKTIQSDYPIGLAKLGTQILAFGRETVEVFRNAGNPSGSPLQRVPELANRIGMGAVLDGTSIASSRHYYATLKNKLYFVGTEGGGYNTPAVFSFNGASFEKVSTTFIDKILSNSQPSHIQATNFFGKEAISFGLDASTTATQRWLMFFPDLGANGWFEWNSTFVQPVSDGNNFIWIDGVTSKWTSQFNILSGWVDGKDAVPFTASVQFQIPKKGFNRSFMNWCALEADTAGSTSNVSVEFSDTDYASFQTARTIDLSSGDKKITKCGSFKTRAVRLSHSANLEFRPESFLARIT